MNNKSLTQSCNTKKFHNPIHDLDIQANNLLFSKTMISYLNKMQKIENINILVTIKNRVFF
jgi:hypothetical protein